MFKEKLKKAVSIFQWLLTTVLISVVLLLIFTAFNPVKSFQVLRVMSGSMEPKIKVGSVVFVQKVKPETLKEGDIITFASAEDPNISVTHRLAAIEEKEGKTVFKTKGDANNTEDMTEVSSSQIKGRVIFSLPFLGYLSVWIKKPLGFGLLVILPAILIIISEILNIKKAIEKEVEKKYAKQEKQPKSKSISSLLIFFLLGIGLFQIKPTNAYFSDVAVIEGNTFSMASDWTPPSASLSITGSFTKSVTEKINNGDFESGLTGWTTAGDVAVLSTDIINDTSPSSAVTVTPVSGSTNMVVIGSATHNIAEDEKTSGNYVWENRLMGSFDSGAKSLSLNYNFFSRDFSPFDDPGFFVRLNGQEIFKLNTHSVNPTNEDDGLAYNTGWSEFYYDLSNHADSKVNLSIYGGNTGDKDVQSWVYVDKITTYFVSAPAHATYTLTGTDNIGGSGIDHYEYNIDGAGWLSGSSFQILTGGTRTLQYRSIDKAGNSSPIYPVRVITDTKAPSNISDFSVDSIASNSATLNWNAPYNDFDNPTSGKAASYDIRYSTTPINEINFAGAKKVDKIPSPKEHNTLASSDVFFDLYQEYLEIIGLNPLTTYYFAIKAADEAPNWTGIATTTGTTTAFAPGTTVNTGDIVINELMWMGSVTGSGDEWIEIRNLTDREIDLSGFTLERPGSPAEILMFTFPAGAKLKPKNDLNKDDYLVVAEFDKDHSSLKNDPDYVVGAGDTNNPDFSLLNSNLEVYLYDNWGDLIDEAWNNTEPKEGYYEINSKYYSMERTSIPEDGTNPLNWYTSIDAASTNEFFDGGADERGTPGAANRSDNEPLAHQSLIPRVTPTPSPTPEMSPTPTPTAEPSPTSEPSPSLSLTSDPTSTSEPSLTVEPTPVPSTMPTPLPSPEPSPTASPELSPLPSPEPTPTLTPIPSPTSELLT